MYYTYHDSPIGKLLLAGDGECLQLLSFPNEHKKRYPEPCSHWQAAHTDRFAAVITQLDAYFAGELQHFDLPLAPQGTEFQLAVWQALQTIPFGKTISYGELAKSINKPTASRAVGAANGANPLPIIIPCHRVIGADGSLTGFGGGLDRKYWLLRHENALAENQDPQIPLLLD